MSPPQLPGFSLLGLIGKGGMSTVHLAQDLHTGEHVAIKMIHPALTLDDEFITRFHKETDLAAQIRHPNIAEVIRTGTHKSQHYIVMRYYKKGDLSQQISQRAIIDIRHVVASVARALAHAHAHGIVHRDIKPANILFGHNDTVVLADFGIAKTIDSTRLTTLGISIGSPHYMSPEQARGKPVDHRSDLYSLGAVLFELLTGRPPFCAEDSFAIALMHINDAIPALPAPWSHLQPLINSLLAKLPENRVSDATKLLSSLDQVSFEPRHTSDTEIARPRRITWQLGFGGTLALAATTFLYNLSSPSQPPQTQPKLNAHPPSITRPLAQTLPHTTTSIGQLPAHLAFPKTSQNLVATSTREPTADQETIATTLPKHREKMHHKQAPKPRVPSKQAAQPPIPRKTNLVTTTPPAAPPTTTTTTTTPPPTPTVKQTAQAPSAPPSATPPRPEPTSNPSPIKLIGNF
jgi:serine/threonine protein kinase